MQKKQSYKIKPRPNLFDLAIIDGFLAGGGNGPAVRREAYWDTARKSQDSVDEL